MPLLLRLPGSLPGTKNYTVTTSSHQDSVLCCFVYYTREDHVYQVNDLTCQGINLTIHRVYAKITT
jgi:hypothetical protein